ncbi:MAG: PulJ/GspJ family protein [Actinomycetota bacterium]
MRRLGDEHGMSIVELTLAMGIFATVMTFTFTATMSAWRSNTGVDRRLRNLAEAREIVNNVAKGLRTAVPLSAEPAFTEAEDFSAEFHANLNVTTGPRLISLFVDPSGRLVQSITEPDAGSGPLWTYSGTAQVRNLGEGVANPTGRPVFVYYDGTGAPLTTPLSDTDLPRVEAVGIRLEIQTGSTPGEPTTVLDRVRLPNIIYGGA